MMYENAIFNVERETDYVFKQLELTTENINNLNTEGYKAQKANHFQEVFRNMQPGKLSITDDESQISLEGAGFFALEDKDGKKYLTRNLQLHTDKDLNLVSDNKYVLPPNTLHEPFSKFIVKTDGEIFGIKAKTSEKISLGHLKVVNYPAAQNLKFDGKYYRETEEAGKAQEVALGNLHQTNVRQKTKELSNVNLPYELTQFTQVNQKLKILSSILLSLNQTRKTYQQALGQIAGGA